MKVSKIISVLMLIVIILIAIFGVLFYKSSSQTKNHQTVTKSKTSKHSSQSESVNSLSSSVDEQKSSSTEAVSPTTPPVEDVSSDDIVEAKDPTATSSVVTLAEIQSVTEELVKSGLPANTWAPSDIKKLIIEAKKQQVPIVEYAQKNKPE